MFFFGVVVLVDLDFCANNKVNCTIMANFQGLLNEATYQDLFNEASDAIPPIVEDNNLGKLCLDEIMDEWKKINFRRSQLLWAVKQRWLRVYEDSRALSDYSYSCEDDLSSTSSADIIPEYSPNIQILLKLYEESPDDIQSVLGYEEFVDNCYYPFLLDNEEICCWWGTHHFVLRRENKLT